MDNSANSILESKTTYITTIETKLNTELGYRYWKSYINTAFWSQISMPINLTITILTALTTAHAASNTILSDSVYLQISLVTLIITTLNTFFKPYQQMTISTEVMKKWFDLGCNYESIFYSDNNDMEDMDRRINSYENLMKNITDLNRCQTPDSQNFISDFIFLCLVSNPYFLKHKTDWLALDCSLRKISLHEISHIKENENENTHDIENQHYTIEE
jgi:hypothetical protein